MERKEKKEKKVTHNLKTEGALFRTEIFIGRFFEFCQEIKKEWIAPHNQKKEEKKLT